MLKGFLGIKSVSVEIAKPLDVVCRFNTYCRTRSFSDPQTEGVLATYYEAIMNDDNTWEVFRLNETSCPKTGKTIVNQTKIDSKQSFESILKQFYVFENGAESLNQVFINTKESFGLDHFHLLAHAEGFAFNTEGAIVVTRNGRIFSEGKFAAEEKEDVLKAHREPASPKKMERQSLFGIFSKAAGGSNSYRQDIKEALQQKTNYEKQILFFDSFEESIVTLNKILFRQILVCHSFCGLIEKEDIKVSLNESGYSNNYRSFNVKKDSGKIKPYADRLPFEMGDGYYTGSAYMDDFAGVLKEVEKRDGVALPPSLYNKVLQLRIISSALQAKAFYFCPPKLINQEDRKKAFSHSMKMLENQIKELPLEMRPDQKTLDAMIVSPREKKCPSYYKKFWMI